MRRTQTPTRRTNPPERSALATHEHEWTPEEETEVFIEDSVATFTQHCMWVEITGSYTSEKHDETFYEEGAKCDATRSYEMELAWLEKRREGGANLYYLGSEIDHFMPQLEDGIIEVERNGEIVEMDPDEKYGEVVIETENWRAKYKADCQPQIEQTR